MMRSSYMAQVCIGILCALLVPIAGCGNPPVQSLAFLTVAATPSALSVGGTATLRAVAHLSDGTTQDVTGGAQWSLSSPAVAKVNNGTLTANEPGTVTVTGSYTEMTPAGNSPAAVNAAPQSLSASIQVAISPSPTPVVPSLTWNSPPQITYGTALSSAQLNATCSVPGAFSYFPAAGAVLSAGLQTLSVTFTPSDAKSYSSATATVTLLVTQAVPLISWAAPAAILQGTALSSTQLDASASVPGTFVYSPAVGTVPALGAAQLTATFTPNDTVDYTSTTTDNTVDVLYPLASVAIASKPGLAIPATFMGLSHEWMTAQGLMGDSDRGVNAIYRQLLQNLTAFGSGPMRLRIGGSSTDRSGSPTATTAQPFAQLAKAMPVKFYLGVNLGADNVGLAVDQATAYANQMPPGALDAIEIGNEPDLYGIQGLRPASYSFQDYLAQFNTWKTQIMPLLAPGTKLLGPSTVDAGWLPETESFLAAEATALSAFSQHYYFADGKANNADDILLSPGASTTGPNEVAAAVNTVHQFGIPFRIGEINSLSSGGAEGISNAFGSALWAVDIMFEFAQIGVDGVNWHTNSCCAYDAFEFDSHGTGASTTYSLTSVNPLYYGLLFFQEATGNSAHLLPVTLTTEANVKAWATVDASDTTRLVLLNKDEDCCRNSHCASQRI